MSAHTDGVAPVAEPTDVSPTAEDRGLPPGQFERLARGVTELLLVDTVTPETEETGLAHVYGESGTQHIVDVETGACSCDDYKYRSGGDDWRCKHGYRAAVATGRRGLPEWADVDALDPYLQERLGLEVGR